MTKFQTIIWTWKLGAPLGFFWRCHQLIRSIIIPYHKLLVHLPLRGTLLDLGCGHGIFLALAKISRPDLAVAGIDLSQNKIDGARLIFDHARMKALSLGVSDISKFPGQSVDVITVIDALYLVPLIQWDIVLKKCHDCLRQNGRILVKEMNRSVKWKFFLVYLSELLSVKTLGLTTMGDGSKFTFPISDDIIKYLERAGFKKIAEESLDRGYYIPHKLWIGYK